MKFLANIADRLANWWAPLPLPPDDFNADWLADVEADHDAWMPDELWAAENSVRAATHEVEPPRMAPTDAPHIPPRAVPAPDSEPAQVSAVGGPFTSDEQLIEELVADYREFLRARFTK